MSDTTQIPHEWLFERTSLEQVKSECNNEGLPDSFTNEYLRHVAEVSNRLEPGDELWKYSSPSDTWQANCGTSGLAIKRNGEIVYSKQLAMN